MVENLLKGLIDALLEKDDVEEQAMTLNDMVKLREELEQKIIEAAKDEIDAIRENTLLVAKELGIPHNRVINALRRPEPAKFVGPNGETWAGRGKKPNWLVALNAEGRLDDEFLVKEAAEESAE